jgi:hypothetical protein
MDALDRELALTLVASIDPSVFQVQAMAAPSVARGEFRVNPLYAETPVGDAVELTRRFPSDDYEQEYGAARQYLPESITVDRSALAALPARVIPAALAEAARRRVVIDLPARYY